MAIIERIVTVYNDKGSKQALKDLNKLEQNFKDAGKKIAKAFGVAALAAGALAVKLGKDAVQGAMEDQKAQISLATALRNTVGATDAQIASTVSYLDALELQVGVNNNELIPSLQKLTQATGDIEQAQSLQALALDVSAGTGKSLIAVTNGIVRAIGGNIGALRKLDIPLDDAIVKNKDLNAALSVLSTTFGGQALNRAETFEFQIERLRLQFDQTLDTLGYALIPVLQELAEVFRTDILPVFERFIAENKDQIAQTLRDVAEFAIKAGKGLASMFKTISDNLTFFQAFGALLFGLFVSSAVYNGVKALIGIITLLTGAFTKQAAAGTAAGTATAFATGGASAVSAAVAIGAFTVAAGTAYYAMTKMTAGLTDNTEAMEKQSSVVVGHLKDLDRLSQATANANLKNLKSVSIITNLNKKTAEQIASEKALAALKKQFKVVPTNEKDPIQLEAARLNLVKQANIEELRKVEALIKNAEAQMKVNENAQRYADILTALADQSISSEEISVLAAKWGVTTGQVLEYIAKIYAVSSTSISTDPIVALLMKWGLTKEEAQKYLDFVKALGDDKIDDKEIEELMGKWGMTRQEVIDYGKKVQEGTTFSDTWAEPGNAAEQSWKDALAALNEYLKATKMKPTPPSTGPEYYSPEDTIILDTKRPFGKPSGIGAMIPKSPSLQQFENEENLRFQTPSVADTLMQSGGQNTGGASVVVNVSGSVISEGDLVESVRTGLLNFQNSGKPIQAIARL